jgi:type I site-specific restriction endonuclease
MKNSNMKQIIKAQQMGAAQKKELDMIDRQNKIRAQLEEKLQREAYEQMMYEQEVARMEREEEELINKLKQTKSLEDQASQELQKAYTDPNVLTRQAPSSGNRRSMHGSSKKGF